jgi:hypothetical protein
MPDFNLTPAVGCLIENWIEDRLLVADGYVARVAGKDGVAVDSFERVVPRCRGSDSAKSWASSNHDAMALVTKPRTLPLPGPRGVETAARIAAAAEAEVAARLARTDVLGSRTSEQRDQYKRYATEIYAAAAEAMGGSMYGDKGRGRLDKDGLVIPTAAFGIAAQTSVYAHSDYRAGPAMTVTSARSCEGVFAGAPPSKRAASYPGAELSLQLLFTKLQRRLKEAGSSMEDFLALLEDLAAPAMDEYGREVPGAEERGVPFAAFRRLSYAMNLQLGDTNLQSILMLLDTERAERVSLPELRLRIAECTGLV